MKLTVKSLLLLASLSATLAYTQTTFQHIIVIVQENRTPDNLFQGLCAPPYGTCPSPYNISPYGVRPEDGTPILLTSDSLADDLDPDHKNVSFVSMYNNGGIDQGPKNVYCDPKNHSQYCCPHSESMCTINGVKVYNWLHYVPNDPFTFNSSQTNRLDPYLALATQYGWANYFFQTNQGPSMPAHQFLLSGTSAPNCASQRLLRRRESTQRQKQLRQRYRLHRSGHRNREHH